MAALQAQQEMENLRGEIHDLNEKLETLRGKTNCLCFSAMSCTSLFLWGLRGYVRGVYMYVYGGTGRKGAPNTSCYFHF